MLKTSFYIGPFEVVPKGGINRNDSATEQLFDVYYGREQMGVSIPILPKGRAYITEELDERISAYRSTLKSQFEDQETIEELEYDDNSQLLFIDSKTEEVLGNMPWKSRIEGLSNGLINDLHPTWLVTSDNKRSVPVSEQTFLSLKDANETIQGLEHQLAFATRPVELANAWVGKLLPDHVMTQDPALWQAPTPWDTLHVVGDNSFTGISAQKAREWLGADWLNTPVTFAEWHLLLHRADVQRLG